MIGPILVLDATSCVGRGVVEAALAAGRAVVAASFDHEGLVGLKAAHPRAELTLLPGDAADDASAEALASDVRRLGRPIAGVIAAACREPVGGRLLETGSEALRRQFEAELLPQFAAARALLPLLADAQRNGSYVIVGGPGGEQPWAGYGQRSIAVAATRMLVRVLHDEARALAVRVHLLAVEMPAKTEANRERACAQWPSTRAIGERALALLEQRDGTRANEAIVRYAWHASPSAPSAPSAPITQATPIVTPASTTQPEPLTPIRDAISLPPPQRRALDDAWAALQPLLSDNHKNKETTP
jgi:NAD(P)-dependent dehydrogenase (short-subunit alcohol dehydrogenase family)